MPAPKGKQSSSKLLLSAQMSLYLHHDAAVYFNALGENTQISNRVTTATTMQPLPEPGAPTPDVTHAAQGALVSRGLPRVKGRAFSIGPPLGRSLGAEVLRLLKQVFC